MVAESDPREEPERPAKSKTPEKPKPEPPADEDFPTLHILENSTFKKRSIEDTECSRNQSSEVPKEQDPLSLIPKDSVTDRMIMQRLKQSHDNLMSIPA